MSVVVREKRQLRQNVATKSANNVWKVKKSRRFLVYLLVQSKKKRYLAPFLQNLFTAKTGY